MNFIFWWADKKLIWNSVTNYNQEEHMNLNWSIMIYLEIYIHNGENSLFSQFIV